MTAAEQQHRQRGKAQKEHDQQSFHSPILIEALSPDCVHDRKGVNNLANPSLGTRTIDRGMVTTVHHREPMAPIAHRVRPRPQPDARLSASPDSVGPTVQQSSLSKKLGMAALGLVSLAGVAGTAQAQEAPEPPESSFSLQLDDTQPEWRLSGSHTNDSLHLLPGAAHGDDLNPLTGLPDDDGWTAGMRFDLTRTEGNEQWVGALRWDMVTQQGAWVGGEDYQGLRTDVAQVGLQKNFRESLNDRTDLYYGVGGGLQLHGPLGGEYFQLKTHHAIGGRLEGVLQDTYTTDRVSFAPVVTGGVALEHQLNDTGSVAFRTSLEGVVAMGPGLSNVHGAGGLVIRPHERVTLEGGATLGAAYSNARALDFYDINGVHPGAYAGMDIKLHDRVHFFANLQTGGVLDEPNYMIGFSIGGGSRPWLNPAW